MFTRAGLVLEHDKTELFHFDRGHTEFHLLLDLGYVSYAGATPLKPKPYWWYLAVLHTPPLVQLDSIGVQPPHWVSSLGGLGSIGVQWKPNQPQPSLAYPSPPQLDSNPTPTNPNQLCPDSRQNSLVVTGLQLDSNWTPIRTCSKSPYSCLTRLYVSNWAPTRLQLDSNQTPTRLQLANILSHTN